MSEVEVNASSVYPDEQNRFLASHVVDKKPGTTPDNCSCCFASNNSDQQWIHLKMNRPYFVDLIFLQGRTDSKYD